MQASTSKGFQIPFMDLMKKVPGGIFIIPLLLGSIINTISLTTSSEFLIPFLSASSTGPIFTLVMVGAGAQVNFRQAPRILGRSAVMLIAKFLAGLTFGLIVGAIFGPAGFLGISTLACYAAVTNSNGGLYLGLMQEYGEPEDTLSYSLPSINDGPYFTMISLGMSGFVSIPLTDILRRILWQPYNLKELSLLPIIWYTDLEIS